MIFRFLSTSDFSEKERYRCRCRRCSLSSSSLASSPPPPSQSSSQSSSSSSSVKKTSSSLSVSAAVAAAVPSDGRVREVPSASSRRKHEPSLPRFPSVVVLPFGAAPSFVMAGIPSGASSQYQPLAAVRWSVAFVSVVAARGRALELPRAALRGLLATAGLPSGARSQYQLPDAAFLSPFSSLLGVSTAPEATPGSGSTETAAAASETTASTVAEVATPGAISRVKPDGSTPAATVFSFFTISRSRFVVVAVSTTAGLPSGASNQYQPVRGGSALLLRLLLLAGTFVVPFFFRLGRKAKPLRVAVARYRYRWRPRP
mmetsp:Transcript_22559/g.47754  ORF Transcript_22559/g.47754 Transcript_22559/m.47754 type:complete len:316 (-) Transcript_22559:29-976(-)